MVLARTHAVALAQAHPNIALIKYWGKRDSALNVPATGSLSVTLDSLWTKTLVRFDSSLSQDELRFNGAEEPRMLARATACLDLMRARADVAVPASIQTSNNFPTSAGLASSASGFAALVVAASSALGLRLEARELSVLARRCSGSAARSIFGGFVELVPGQRDDGDDSYAIPLLDAADWPLSVVVAVTSRRAKPTGSTEGMEQSRRTSPFYPAWVDTTAADHAAARRAVLGRDFEALAVLTEHSCLKMHAVMLSTRPGLLYWTGATVDCLHRIRSLRERAGLRVFFTVDAGPQVKAVCQPRDADQVAAALREIPGVDTVLTSALGAGARTILAVEGGP